MRLGLHEYLQGETTISTFLTEKAGSTFLLTPACFPSRAISSLYGGVCAV